LCRVDDDQGMRVARRDDARRQFPFIEEHEALRLVPILVVAVT
jgi:hypothetical protein